MTVGEQFIKAMASPEAQGGIMGLTIGSQMGSSFATAQYNKSAMNAAAESTEEQGRLAALLIQKKYETDYRELSSQQERQAAANQAVAAKRGITGGSAEAAMSSYAAKDQRNKARLYHNAAMQTGAQSLQTSSLVNQYKEKARQYAYQGQNAIVSGLISMGAGGVSLAAKYMTGKESPVESLLGGHDTLLDKEQSLFPEFYEKIKIAGR